MRALFFVLVFVVFGLGGLRAANQERPAKLKALNEAVGKILGVRDDLVIGSSGFDVDAMKALSGIGSRDSIVAAVMERTKAAGMFVQIFYCDSDLSFQWSSEEPETPERGGVVYYATVDLKLDARDRPSLVATSQRTERRPRTPLVPIPN